MKLIAHRGLFQGPDKSKENSPEQIIKAVSLGFDCEVDLWVVDQNLYLGHDGPVYPIKLDFLLSYPLWIHAKNLDALDYLTDCLYRLTYFWHQQDDFTLTSDGYIWTYPGKPLTKNSVMVMPEWNSNIEGCIRSDCYGICSDFVESIRSQYKILDNKNL